MLCLLAKAALGLFALGVAVDLLDLEELDDIDRELRKLEKELGK